jgi:hypothetical protein
LLIKFVDPYLFAITSEYQATSSTFLAAHQAINQVHFEAGCNITIADLNFVFKLYGTDPSII